MDNETSAGLDLQAIFDEQVPLPEDIEERVKGLTLTQQQVERIVAEAADDLTKRERLEAVYKAALKRLEQREKRREYFMRAVRDWVAKQIGRKKPRQVEIIGESPCVLSLRKSPDRVEIADFATFARHVEEGAAELMGYEIHSRGMLTAEESSRLMALLPADLRECLKVKSEPRKTKIKEQLEQLGFLPPGCVLVPGEDRLTIDPGLPEAKQIEGELS